MTIATIILEESSDIEEIYKRAHKSTSIPERASVFEDELNFVFDDGSALIITAEDLVSAHTIH